MSTSSLCRRFLRPALLILALAAGLPFARAAEDAFDTANQAFAEGRYDQAATLYRQAIDARGTSPALCFNLGNAELKAGHLGPAILAYEQARHLAPADRDIDHNLQLARRQAGLAPNSYRWWQVALRSAPPHLWIYLADAGLALIALAMLAHGYADPFAPRLRLRPDFARRTAKTLLFVAIPATLFLGYAALLAAPRRIEGVVIAPGATLRLSPFASADKLDTIPEGELVTVERRHQDYLWIEGRDKHYGWVSAAEVAPIIPGTFEPQP